MNLYGYVTFITKVRENAQKGFDRENAIKKAIVDCIREGVLAEYLENNASEVINMLFGEWNLDDAKAVLTEEAKSEEREKWQTVVSDKDKVIADNAKKIAGNAKMLADKDSLIADNAKVLADKDSLIADNAKVLADKDSLIANKDAEIAALRAQLGIE